MQKSIKTCDANTAKLSARKNEKKYNLKDIRRQIWAVRGVIILILAVILPLDLIATVEGHNQKVKYRYRDIFSLFIYFIFILF